MIENSSKKKTAILWRRTITSPLRRKSLRDHSTGTESEKHSHKSREQCLPKACEKRPPMSQQRSLSIAQNLQQRYHNTSIHHCWKRISTKTQNDWTTCIWSELSKSLPPQCPILNTKLHRERVQLIQTLSSKNCLQQATNSYLIHKTPPSRASYFCLSLRTDIVHKALVAQKPPN